MKPARRKTAVSRPGEQAAVKRGESECQSVERGELVRRSDALRSTPSSRSTHPVPAVLAAGTTKATMKRVLIVDDDKKSTAALAIRLRAAGHEVLSAPDGLAGLKLAIDRRPDLIVMDVWMPGGVGILIAQRLKHVGLADIPVIFLTASRKEDVWGVAEEVEPAGFFEKPCESKQLLESINLILAGAASLPAQMTSPRKTLVTNTL